MWALRWRSLGGLVMLFVILLDRGAGEESSGSGSGLDGSGRGEQGERLLVLLLQLKQFRGIVLAPL